MAMVPTALLRLVKGLAGLEEARAQLPAQYAEETADPADSPVGEAAAARVRATEPVEVTAVLAAVAC